jgi:hypothetical protein
MAAQNNTNGLLGPNDSLNTVLHNDSPSPNVAVHTFDPEASPAQKGAVAGKGKENLKDVRQTPDGEGEKGPFFLSCSVFSALNPVV